METITFLLSTQKSDLILQTLKSEIQGSSIFEHVLSFFLKMRKIDYLMIFLKDKYVIQAKSQIDISHKSMNQIFDSILQNLQNKKELAYIS